ncbi:MAG: DUF4384 domain-containing protein [Gammaproteobacteria bacterium]|nr:DUF4384 domain-containing protein [Gammaproteobacteria bacterium]
MNTALRLAASCTAMAAIGFAAVADEGADTYLKDLDIRQHAMVEEFASPPASQGGGLAVEAAVDRANRVYTHGDHVVLTVKATEDSYIWVFDTGTSGKAHQIFPNRYDEENFLKAGSTLHIPPAGSDYALAVSHPKGAELITVVATKENTPLTPDLVDLDAGAGPFLALQGTADSVAKDLAITLRRQEAAWTRDQVVILIE